MSSGRDFNDFYLTGKASLTASLTGGLSAVSSCFIMYIILRSESKLSTTYHRIMFFMSFWDLFTSLAIALTTIPMPSENIYEFEGASYGNTTTCSAQGFVAYVGSIAAILSNCILSIYYLCVLRFKITEVKIKKCLEPVLFFLTLVLSLYPGIQLWRYGLINPQEYDPYCTIGPYPFHCQYGDPSTCIRGGEMVQKMTFMTSRYFFIIIVVGILTIAVSMIMIVRSIRAAEKVIVQSSQVSDKPLRRTAVGTESNEHGDDNLSGLDENSVNLTLDRARRAHSNSKVITIQALMYVGAFVLTWIFTIMTFRMSSSVVVAMLKLIFQPSQGFFNALIFVYHKMQNVTVTSPHLNLFEVFRLVLTRPRNVPEVKVSMVELVDLHNMYKRLHNNFALHPDDLSFANSDSQDEPQDDKSMVGSKSDYEKTMTLEISDTAGNSERRLGSEYNHDMMDLSIGHLSGVNSLGGFSEAQHSNLSCFSSNDQDCENGTTSNVAEECLENNNRQRLPPSTISESNQT